MDEFIRFLNPLLMILAGLAVGVVVVGRRAGGWRLYGVGAWTFILSQVLHIPFNLRLLNPLLERWSPEGLRPGSGLVVGAVLLGLSAGLFEETARWAAYRFAMPKARTWREALAFGAGHGGVEAVLVGAFALYGVLQLVALRAEGAAALLGPEQLDRLAVAQTQVAAFWALPWYGVFLGALERIFAICFHLSAAVLVLQVFRRGSPVWWAAAVLWHTLLNAAAVFGVTTFGPYWTEGLLALFAAVSLGIVWRLKEDEQEPVAGGAEVQDLLDLSPVDLSPEEIEDSRFD